MLFLGHAVISMSRTIAKVSETELIVICAELTFGLIDGSVIVRFETVDTGEGERISSLIF